MTQIERLRAEGRVEVTAVYDADAVRSGSPPPSGSDLSPELDRTTSRSASTPTSTPC